jgi:hypothetical protein
MDGSTTAMEASIRPPQNEDSVLVVPCKRLYRREAMVDFWFPDKMFLVQIKIRPKLNLILHTL